MERPDGLDPPLLRAGPAEAVTMAEAAPRRDADLEAVPAHLTAEMGIALLCPLDDLFPFASPEA